MMPEALEAPLARRSRPIREKSDRSLRTSEFVRTRVRRVRRCLTAVIVIRILS